MFNKILEYEIKKINKYAELISQGYSHEQSFIKAYGIKTWDEIQTTLSLIDIKKNVIKINN